MKDARGHGSEIRNAGLRGVTLAPGFRAVSHMKPVPTDTARTVQDMRARLAGTGPGHAIGLMQGIRNLLGGR